VPRWLSRLLRRIHDLAGRGQVRFTLKAARELAALGAGMDAQDACDVLAALRAEDFAKRFESEHTGEWMYVFKPAVAGTVVYLKLVLRAECLVVSFHEDEGESDEERQ
jgi:Motility quorum-sensing regulator, toxin of MqsA